MQGNTLRKHVLKMVYDKQSGHIGGSFSIADLIAYLYTNFDLAKESESDRLILSKGHAVPILYAALHELGHITSEELDTFRDIDSRLQGHPDRQRMPLMHATTGSLGQGLSIAIGHALAMKRKQSKFKSICILGDGEMQEGQVWEALMLAPKYNLDNLLCFLDYNGSQNDGNVNDILSLEPIYSKLVAFGWDTYVLDGHDLEQLDNIKSLISYGRPKFVILKTEKGHGVEFMKDPSWHSKAPNTEQYEKAMEELNG